MSQIYTDIMVDLETTGTQPNRNAVIEIGAVKFNLHERTVSPNAFNRCLKIPKHRHWDESTKQWWQKQGDVLPSILKRGEDPKQVMTAFVDWVNPAQGPLRFWAKPTTFDYMFISSYLHDFDQPVGLFDFREATDMRSFFRGIYYPDPIDTSDEPEFKGVAHNAIIDCLNQIKLVFHHADKKLKADGRAELAL
jgi:hypothetical protein